MTFPFDPALVRANVPAELQDRRQWVLWRLETVKGKRKPTKVPYTTRGTHARSTAPTTWCSLEEALAAQRRREQGGVGFVFAGDGLVGVDLDHCRDAETGALAPWATAILAALASYTEVSPSGTGVHVLVRGALSGSGRKRPVREDGAHPEAAVEIYDRGRYFTVTGSRLPEYPAGIEDRQAAVDRLYASLDTKEPTAPAQGSPRQPGHLGDDEVLRRAIGARNGASFLRLWNGDTSGHAGDDSSADLALCSHLAFWCRGDVVQVDRLFRRSRLYREKWDRQDYRERTLAKALEGRTEFYEPAGPAALPARRSPASAAPDPWQSPIPFDAASDLPAFPTDAFPVSVADWIRAEAVSTQTPEDLPGMIALSVLATAAAKKYRATIRPEWVEPLNVYTEVTLPPGERKSAVFRDATAPLLDWERDAIQREGPRLRGAALSLEIAEGRLKDAKTRAIKARGADRLVAEEDLRCLNEDVAALPRAVAPRVLADDVTPERLFGLLTEQGGRLGILSPEGGIFDLLAGRYSDGLPNLDAFLKAHSGDQLRVDRIGRPAEHLREPALTVGLAVQPAVIEGLADKPGFRGRGLLARFLYSVPKSLVGRRRVDPPPVPAGVTAAYAATVWTLLDLPADRGQDGEIVSRALHFSPEAVEVLLRFSGEIEPRLAEGGDLEAVRDWAAKLPGAVARIAGLLTLADGADPGSSGGCGGIGGPSTVSREAVERAILLGRYLIPHALAAFGLMGTNREKEDSLYLLRWILRRPRDRFTKREVWQETKGGRFQKAEDLDPPLQDLEERGYIRRDQDEQRRGGGRRPSPSYSVNPGAYSVPQFPHFPHNGTAADPDAPATPGHSSSCDCPSCVPASDGDSPR
ncbi:MAG: DUF3987 domain-containing protein [Planctomycetaceae bacterium]|nr:DUF3987 domain-containing protein [Planctomycetota bacterium]MCK6530885.1 DUF3987 domain-containing protein [Myxococcota bacterium]NUN51874.1 DUF3987 domain-containing protein [Planctomycetaceae bacterium]